ncbi:hypothetical protein NHX12_027596 [Muraenolepis orangiensis]|uniref:Uncharacterized protein n=1 Tax=Muraenolepis orangiensis TaxID=630683 RepID=A0A9Q0EGW3_9TELE|nr:hypothetical protein NHX12_027596 [Muraenolepis orangiensis]
MLNFLVATDVCEAYARATDVSEARATDVSEARATDVSEARTTDGSEARTTDVSEAHDAMKNSGAFSSRASGVGLGGPLLYLGGPRLGSVGPKAALGAGTGLGLEGTVDSGPYIDKGTTSGLQTTPGHGSHRGNRH